MLSAQVQVGELVQAGMSTVPLTNRVNPAPVWLNLRLSQVGHFDLETTILFDFPQTRLVQCNREMVRLIHLVSRRVQKGNSIMPLQKAC
jgi:hypothetical protein